MEGGVVKWEWFKPYAQLPNNGQGGYIAQSWDTAMSLHESSSYSACTTWFCYGDQYYLIGVWRQRLESPDLLTFIHQHAMEYKADIVIIEEHNGSKALIEILLRHTLLNLFWVRPTESKVQRIIGELPALAGGCVFIPEHADWLPTFRNEMIKFPGGKQDDQVDSTSQFLLWARLRGPKWPNGGGRRGRGLPNGPIGPFPQSTAVALQSQVTIIESDPPDLDLSELY